MHLVPLAFSIGDYWFLLFAAPFMAWFGIGGLIRASREKKRTEALRKVAGDLELHFENGGAPALLAELGRFTHIWEWSLAEIRNIMKGSVHGAEVCLFDFSGTAQGSRSRKYFTVARFRLPDLHLATFTLQPEQMVHKLFDAGFGDIDFAEFPAFSEMFLLAGPDEAEIRRLFDREVTGILESKRGITVEAQGEEMLVYRATSRPEPAAFGALLSEGLSLFAAFVASRNRTQGGLSLPPLLPPPLPVAAG